MVYILISILAGVSIVVARILNYNLAERIGIFQGTFFNYVTGLSFSLIILLISNETQILLNANIQRIPLWAYTGGAVGVIVVAMSSYITPKMSAFYLTLFVFIGQLLAGVIIDYFSSGTLSFGKIAGGLLVLAGLTYNLILDRYRETGCYNGQQSS